MKKIHSQPSWELSVDGVEAAVTRLGGHLGPVRFRLGDRWVEPFSVAPWSGEKLAPGTPSILKALRGDFFCLPFGVDRKGYRGEVHPPHGETCNAEWSQEAHYSEPEGVGLHLSLKTEARPGLVDKYVHLRTGQSVVYLQHVVSGMSGKMTFGHHATLKFPDYDLSGNISTSPIRFAQVAPQPFENPAAGGYQSLQPGAEFSDLAEVPSVFGGTADLSSYPARRGFEDLVMMVHESETDFAWTAVVFPREGWLWFALKDPRVLRSTVCWMSNGGRHYAPWNGRHVNVMGLEDVTAYFDYGIGASVRPNAVNSHGYPTAISLSAKHPLRVNYIMGVCAVPRGFSRVKEILPESDRITLVSDEGRRISTSVNTDFLRTSEPGAF